MISTGVATKKDIELAVSTCKKAGNNQIALLKCTSSYPASSDEMNLLAIPRLKEDFNTIVGLSDHSIDRATPIVAVSLGAKIIEKHFILKRKLGGPDAAFSMEPEEFSQMVRDVRASEKILGQPTYQLSPKQKVSRQYIRSLFAVSNIMAGESFTENNVRSIRPGNGLHPKYLRKVLSAKASKNIKAGTPLSLTHIKKPK